ncbi:ImmA/IrrE family metallo-endopeptidase (plasmid) [Bradyrhizobium sp. CCGUVB1N3]|uniref:ImmA/IrrE family metallo-endopeptidase n=1 Tax=Bradyrhizobium sp. CCGUVB1N3 TaxID=2949629 RepID=UPI0020B37699|nr:ImmA/IrrE family metallo-endopeptidase [Bradyrhizobium sp. CCGUVB1N3]MCP3478036.1 ImmA/IrrE family metallo-endopeptidase [Bradyrhizobium sp. CCGUVB1N3]
MRPPIPIERLCAQLDIVAIEEHDSDNFEGVLVTDVNKHSGSIGHKRGRPRQRSRFTIAHELGHFLIATHKPLSPDGFRCTRADMYIRDAAEADRRGRMEVEANQFASLMLMPPPFLRQAFKTQGEPNLRHVPAMAVDFDVSKEAMARAYAENHPEPLAIVITQNGRILRSYRNRIRFPFIQPRSGDAVPRGSLFHRGNHQRGAASATEECVPDLWIEVKRGERAPTVYEQVLLQQEGFAMIMLHLEQAEEGDEEEERDLERSWQPRFRR